MTRFDVALILLYDDDGKVLLQHRTKDAATLPGYWAFFGGRLNEGETPLAAVRREAKEELDYTLANPELILQREFSEAEVSGVLYVFAQKFTDDPLLLRLQEGQGWGWFDPSGTAALKMCGRDREILQIIWTYIHERYDDARR